MRLSIVVAITAVLLLKLTTISPVEATTQQQQQRQLYFLPMWPQWHSNGRSNLKEHARSADGSVGGNTAAQDSADSGRGFMAQLIKFKSMFHPTQSPSSNANAPEYAPTTTPITATITIPTSPIITTPTSPIITTPTSPIITTSTSPIITTPTSPTSPTITIPTTTTSRRVNTRRNGYSTQVVYGRQDKDDGQVAEKQKGKVGSVKPSITNQTPMIGQLPRPQRRIHRGQLNRNNQKRRLQKRRIETIRNRNKFNERWRMQLQAAVGGKPLQQKNQRRKVVKVQNRNRIANRNGDFGGKTLDNKDNVDIVNIGGNSADNKLNTNSRLQNFMNALRHPQTPIVFNH